MPRSWVSHWLQLVKTGVLVYAKREFLGHKKYLSPSPAAAEGDSSQVALLRSGSGVAGVADAVSKPLTKRLPTLDFSAF
jgi:hypothetical protein